MEQNNTGKIDWKRWLEKHRKTKPPAMPTIQMQPLTDDDIKNMLKFLMDLDEKKEK